MRAIVSSGLRVTASRSLEFAAAAPNTICVPKLRSDSEPRHCLRRAEQRLDLGGRSTADEIQGLLQDARCRARRPRRRHQKGLSQARAQVPSRRLQGKERRGEVQRSSRGLRSPEGSRRSARPTIEMGFYQPGQDFRPPPDWQEHFRGRGEFGPAFRTPGISICSICFPA